MIIQLVIRITASAAAFNIVENKSLSRRVYVLKVVEKINFRMKAINQENQQQNVLSSH